MRLGARGTVQAEQVAAVLHTVEQQKKDSGCDGWSKVTGRKKAGERAE